MEAYAPEVPYGFPMISVIADGFCAPYPIELIVKKKYFGFFDARYEVFDINGNLFLKVDGSSRNLQKKRVMTDRSGSTILTMREKALMLRHRWTVHRGESSEQKDLMFTVERSHPLQMKTRLDIFLPTNTNKDVSNFQLVGSYTDLSCRVYKGDTMIAEVTDGFTWRNFTKGKESFRVKINAGVDYAFVVGLLVIVTENDYI